jgi:hypothetical protein
VPDDQLVCLRPIGESRVRGRCDRLSAFMVGRMLHRPSKGLTVMFVAFDCPAVAGVDLRLRPWAERRGQLEALLAGGGDGCFA